MKLRTCVSPEGQFRYALHKPSYQVDNLRQQDHLLCLGRLPDGTEIMNQTNFPKGQVNVDQASMVYEIPNAFAFRGTTFIDSSWADPKAEDPSSIRIIASKDTSMTETLMSWAQREDIPPEATKRLFSSLPRSILLALATTSTDENDLVLLAQLSCQFRYSSGQSDPDAIEYRQDNLGYPRPVIHDHDLFEAVGNNPYLPDKYKEVMVLRPGAQGSSEIVGDYRDEEGQTHIFEYLRRNSYIPWGHYAANMAHDRIRYRMRDLSLVDLQGLRHLYYQRIFVRLAHQLGLAVPQTGLSIAELETLRQQIHKEIRDSNKNIDLSSSLWGWNFGFDFAPTGYRLHGSHQQVHQQNAMIPDKVRVMDNGRLTDKQMNSFGCGDLVSEVASSYREETGQNFFDDLIRCLRSNKRTDGGEGEPSLIVYEDDHVLLFVPKAQVSQWELQLMPLSQVGNILEADTACRASLDKAMLLALKILEDMGAKMITSIEFPKRFTEQDSSQRLLYSFLPKLPWSPGSFSEAQNRYISGHYPEDFATACRLKLNPDLL